MIVTFPTREFICMYIVQCTMYIALIRGVTSYFFSTTVSCNQMGTVFTEMSSQTAMNYMISCCYLLYFFIMHFLQLLLKCKIFKIKIQKDPPFILLVLNAVLITVNHAKAVQDDISTKNCSHLIASQCT